MVSYRLSEDDILAGNDLWRRHQIKPFALAVLFLIVWAGFGFLAFHLADKSVPGAAVLGGLTAAAGIFGILIANRTGSGRNALRYFRQSSNARHEISLEWNETHVSLRQPDAYNNLPWRDVQAWQENDAVLVLIQAGPLFNPIPKRALTEEQLQSLRTCLLTAGIPKGRHFPI